MAPSKRSTKKEANKGSNLSTWLTVSVAIVAIWAGAYYAISQPGEITARLGSGQMFNAVAKNYDIANKWMSLGLDQSWRIVLVDSLKVQPNDQILDLAVGTADVALLEAQELKKLGGKGKIMGVDPSVGMLAVGQTKVDQAQMAGVITLKEGDAQKLEGLSDGSFNKVSMSFGIRNVPDRAAALREIYRVSVKSEDTIIGIMEFALPTSGILKHGSIFFIRYIMPVLGAAVTGLKDEYMHLQRSIINFPPPSEFAQLMTDSGLEVFEVRNVCLDVVQLYLARPRLS